MKQLYLDCDGVLADFDTAAEQLFNQNPRDAEALLGTEEFWIRIRSHENFYGSLPLLADARRLHEAVVHLNPIILTGCPEGGWAESQKIEWAARHFPGVEIITCRSKDKRDYLKNRGDVLVDDYLRYRHLWVEAGGIFVHHISAEQSIHHLEELGLPLSQITTNPSRTDDAGEKSRQREGAACAWQSRTW